MMFLVKIILVSKIVYVIINTVSNNNEPTPKKNTLE